jgi:hypothetical protein
MKTWEGISLHKQVAELDMHGRCVQGVHQFKTCLRAIRDEPATCRRMDCIVGRLVMRLLQCGAKIPEDL